MPTTPIFKWEPSILPEWNELFSWRTMTTQMESGKIRTRKKWTRPRRSASQLNVGFLDHGEVDELFNFHYGCCGAFAAFYMPSWSRETRLATAATTGDTVIGVEKYGAFTTTPNMHGNIIHLASIVTPSLMEVTFCITMIDSFTIGVSPALVNDYPFHNWVQRAYLMRFADDNFKKTRRGYYIYEVEISVVDAT